MKRAGVLGIAFLLLFGGLQAQQGGFSAQLSPEELHRAGLDKLSPEERSQLDALVTKYGKSMASMLVIEPSPQAVEKRAREAPTAREGGGWLSWLRSKPSEKPPELVIESRMVGTLRGWDHHTIFNLENGQAWQVSDYSKYVQAPPIRNPEVRIRPGGVFGAYILLFPANAMEIRVAPAN